MSLASMRPAIANTLRKLRFFFLFVLCLVSGAAHAESLAEVCQQLIGSQVSRCMAAPGGRHVSPPAAKVCGQLIGEQVIDCVRAISGKEYTSDEATTCGGLIGTQVIDCLRGTGRIHVDRPVPPPYAPPPPTYGSPGARCREEGAAQPLTNGR